jgi:hypothetical protein
MLQRNKNEDRRTPFHFLSRNSAHSPFSERRERKRGAPWSVVRRYPGISRIKCNTETIPGTVRSAWKRQHPEAMGSPDVEKERRRHPHTAVSTMRNSLDEVLS